MTTATPQTAPGDVEGAESAAGVAPEELERSLVLTPFVSTLRERAASVFDGWARAHGLRRVRSRYLTDDAGAKTRLLVHLAHTDGPEFELHVAGREAPLEEGWRELATTPQATLHLADDVATQRALAHPAVRAAVKALAAALRRASSAEAVLPGWVDVDAALNGFGPVQDRYFRWVGQYDGVAQGVLRLGFRCNQDCGFCWQGRQWPEPPAEYYETWLEEMLAGGVRRLVISGGEPTLHRGLEALVRRAGEFGVAISLQSNAVLLGRRDRAKRLAEAGLTEVSVSLHAPTAELSDAMTRAPGTFVRTMAGIEAVLECGLGVNLTCVVERANAHALVDHARLIVDRFGGYADRMSVAYAHPTEYYDRAQWDTALVPLDVSGPAVGEAVTILRRAGMIVNVQGGCGFPTCALRDFPEALQSLSRDRLPAGEVAARIYADECEGCAMKGGCIGLRREYVDRFGGRGVRPFAEAQEMVDGIVR